MADRLTATLWADQALTAQGWQNAVTLTIDGAGRIASLSADTTPGDGATRHGCLLAAPVNAHSHAFQRAMAGLTEARGPQQSDSFWTWRSLMYRFLGQITPEQVQAIAAFAQMEMLETGFAACAEFHYLHHQADGTAYANRAELGVRIMAAAQDSGIGLTLLPVLYEQGGCDGRALEGGQRRFANTPDGFAALCDAAHSALGQGAPDWGFGIAPHSLRAVSPASLGQAAALANALSPGAPIHMHLAEQQAEVAEVQAALGARPVEWVLENLSPDAGWNFVHCTQMQPHETTALAASGARAVLCPITESSLGDGMFDGVRWFSQGGNTAIGTDSNIRISLPEELRTLEYSQRLRDHSRAALATQDSATGRRLFDAITTGGAHAAGRATGPLATGQWADILALDTAHPDLAGLTGDRLLDAWIFARGDGAIGDVWSAGRHMVQGGRHIQRDAITAAYVQATHPLRAPA